VPLHSSSLLSAAIAGVLRSVARTWRLRLHDQAGILDSKDSSFPLIWVLWHNRLLVIPIIYERYFTHRKGAVLISRSRDGGILADCIERFGGEPVRGSSSRGGASALRELQRRVAEGCDAYITPDGPKGPRYSVSAGALWLGQMTGAPILPVSVECSSCWRLGRWDGFIIPMPFAKVDVTLRKPHAVPPSLDEDSIKGEQERLRELLMSHTDLH
jgi:lysophospholipid acyltransferase (LPLAT)-like uncharacterized protein